LILNLIHSVLWLFHGHANSAMGVHAIGPAILNVLVALALLLLAFQGGLFALECRTG